MKNIPRKSMLRQAGVSLIELMISITVGVIILGAILAVYATTSSTSKQSENATRMSEDAAIALTFMGNYIRQAGYGTPRSAVTAGNNGYGAQGDANFTGIPLLGCDRGFSNPTVALMPDLACNSTGSATSAISLRFEGDAFNTIPSGSSPTDCLGQIVPATTPVSYTPDTGGTIALVEARFFVKTGTNSGVPELYCAGNGGASNFTAQPIMQYVESLSLSYGVAANGDEHTARSYMTATEVLNNAGEGQFLGAERWRNVVSVKVCLVMRSELPDQNGSGSYVNCAGSTVTSPGGYLRKAFSSTITMRNRGWIA
jgi:type IV pilus assembly protein PilW